MHIKIPRLPAAEKAERIQMTNSTKSFVGQMRFFFAVLGEGKKVDSVIRQGCEILGVFFTRNVVRRMGTLSDRLCFIVSHRKDREEYF